MTIAGPGMAAAPIRPACCRFWDRAVAVLARLARDTTELVQSRRRVAVPAATLGRQQMAALSG
jgi:hypothetical protein